MAKSRSFVLRSWRDKLGLASTIGLLHWFGLERANSRSVRTLALFYHSLLFAVSVICYARRAHCLFDLCLFELRVYSAARLDEGEAKFARLACANTPAQIL
jgi:hypothetical protein